MANGGLTFDNKVEDGIACLNARQGSFQFGTSLEEKENFLELFEQWDSDSNIQAILLFNDEKAFDVNAHRNYVNCLQDLCNSENRKQAEAMLERENNAINQVAMVIARSQKIIVSCMRGELSTPFFGLSLISDIRLAATGASFNLSHVENEAPPIGGLGYMLPKFIGPSRSAQLLLFGGVIEAPEAKEQGIINEILPLATFEEDCIEYIKSAIVHGTIHIAATRELMRHDFNDFASYLDMEKKARRKSFYLTQ